MKRCWWVLLLALVACAPVAHDDGWSHTAIGINYDWWRITSGTNRAHCRHDVEPRDDTYWFLQSYDKPAIGAKVLAQLHAMRASGFTSLRVMVFHDHSSDAWESDSFTSLDGSIRAADRRKLARFIGDVGAAGFHTIEVVPSFQWRNDLYCQVRSIGDCFDPRRTGENWRFIAQVAQIARAAAGAMALRFDLGNEDAPDPAMPAGVRANAKRYIQTIAQRFQSEYGSNWTFSVARSDRGTWAETRNRLGLLLDDLAEIHLRPRFLEIHTYDTDAQNLQATLDVTQEIAHRIGARIVLGELAYHNAVQARAIERWLRQHPNSRVDDVMQWPEYDPSLACAPLPHPPYTPGALGAIAPQRPPVARPDGTPQWLVASDIHLDPFDRSPDPANYGSDTNPALFRSALSAMTREVPKPSVVVLPGDFLVHGFPKKAGQNGAQPTAAAIATMRTIARGFARAYPQAQFAIALGNNDAPCGDYRSDAEDPYLKAVARIWAPMIDRHGSAPRFTSAFDRGGYYTVALPADRLRLVVLNTVLFSSEYRGSCGGDARHAAARELAWLRATLRATPAGTRNVAMMHVPPGFDPFATEVSRGFVPWPFLDAHDGPALLQALSDPANHVAYAIAGHAHRFDFRLDQRVPILVFGSISPVYHNNPAFYGLRIGPTGSLRDLAIYAYDDWSQRWRAPRGFDAAWHVSRIDAGTLHGVHVRLGTDPALRPRWDAQSSAWPSNPEVLWGQWRPLWWRVPWCAQTELDGGFVRCAHIERRATLGRVILVSIVLAIVAAIALAAFLISRRLLRASKPH